MINNKILTTTTTTIMMTMVFFSSFLCVRAVEPHVTRWRDYWQPINLNKLDFLDRSEIVKHSDLEEDPFFGTLPHGLRRHAHQSFPNRLTAPVNTIHDWHISKDGPCQQNHLQSPCLYQLWSPGTIWLHGCQNSWGDSCSWKFSPEQPKARYSYLQWFVLVL